MTYFSHLVSFNSPGNALQRAVVDLLKEKSNLLVADPHGFIDQLSADVISLNGRFPRCSSLTVYDSRKFDFHAGRSISISLSRFNVIFFLHPVKEESK